MIKTAAPSKEDLGPIPGATMRFSEEDFTYLSVFDSLKPESLYKLKTYREQSNSTPKAVVVLFHGLKSHSNRGANLAKYFAARNIVTVAFDFRGFGRSQGSKGLILNEESFLSDS